MRTIAIVSQKGGAGKTTLAGHLATEAAANGLVTLLVDTDPQAAASRWFEWRKGSDPEVIDCGAPSLLAGKLAKAHELGAQLVIIDTPPHADAMARQAARLADLILVPCRPKAFDLAAIEATADLIKSNGKAAATGCPNQADRVQPRRKIKAPHRALRSGSWIGLTRRDERVETRNRDERLRG